MDRSIEKRIFIPSYLSESNLNGHEQIITGNDAHHLKNVLRMKIGEFVIVCYADGSEYKAMITQLSDSVILSIQEKIESDTELPVNVTLYQAYPKGDKFDLITQKCTELGIFRIVPVISERCIVRLDDSSAEKKIHRLEKIAEGAAKQSGRIRIPEITMPVSFDEALADIKSADKGFICYEGGGTKPLPELLSGLSSGSVSFFIGPEGGLSLREAELAANADIPLAGLGRRILRTETAPIFVMSAISLLFC